MRSLSPWNFRHQPVTTRTQLNTAFKVPELGESQILFPVTEYGLADRFNKRLGGRSKARPGVEEHAILQVSIWAMRWSTPMRAATSRAPDIVNELSEACPIGTVRLKAPIGGPTRIPPEIKGKQSVSHARQIAHRFFVKHYALIERCTSPSKTSARSSPGKIAGIGSEVLLADLLKVVPLARW